MTHTDLLAHILETAEAIRAECGGEQLSASHIAAAVSDFCKTRYTGFDFSTYSYPRFEDERLRYLFSKEVKLSAYFRMRLRRNRKDGVEEAEFDITRCEELAALRGAHILSADVVFLCALRDLHESYRPNARRVTDNASVLACLQDADANIYDYVIENIADICCQLQKKSDEAAAIRDWKPAAKFAEPEELGAMCFEKIEKNLAGNVMTLKFPRFFGTTDLKISIHSARGVYYIHDNGCAIRHLAKQVTDRQKQTRILQRVCHPRWIVGKRTTGCFTSTYSFFHYLQRLVFVAHADLYYTRAERCLREDDKSYRYVGAEKADPLNETALLSLLKEGIGFHYDENRGLTCRIDANCSLSSSHIFLVIETLDAGKIRISERKRGAYEPEILEGFLWDSDDITPYGKIIGKFADRFGAEFDGRDIYLTDKTENFFKALQRFLQLAVLLSAFGYDIAVPKVKR